MCTIAIRPELFVFLLLATALLLKRTSAACAITPDKNGQVLIPSEWKSIEDEAFKDCTTLTSITIGGSVSNIGDYAFSGCSKLVNVTIHEGVREIGKWAFARVSNLASIVIPDSTTDIGGYAFALTGLRKVHLGASLTRINDSVFEQCQDLVNVTIPEGVTSLNPYAFSSCTSLSHVELPTTLRSIGRKAFQRTSLTSITIGGSVSNIGDYAFSKCSKLVNVTIHEGVQKIGAYAFESLSSLASIVIPDSMTVIGISAFRYCRGLRSVHLGASLTSIGIDVFGACTGLVNVTIPEGVTSLGYWAFSYCTSLSHVELPTTLRSIGVRAFQHTSLTSAHLPESVETVANETFFNCKSLTNVTLGKALTSIGSDVFSGCSSLTAAYLNTPVVGMRRFADVVFGNAKSSVVEVTIGSSVSSIGDYAFKGCSKLVNVTIHEGVQKIGAYAFESLSSLASIVIPDSMTVIRISAFRYCRGLRSVRLGASLTSTGFDTFGACTGLVNVTIPEGVTSLGGQIFSYCTSLSHVELPTTLRSIGVRAFQHTSLTSAHLPESVETVANRTFLNCKSLTNVTLGKALTSIGSDVFSGCSSLTAAYLNTPVVGMRRFADVVFGNAKSSVVEVTIGSSVSSIGDYAFKGCSKLVNVTIREGVQKIGGIAFSSCPALRAVTIPASVVSITGGWSFSSCRSLTSVTFAKNSRLKRIYGEYMFRFTPIENLTLPGSLSEVSDKAFSQMPGLQYVEFEPGGNFLTLGDSLFAGDTYLQRVVFNTKVKVIFGSSTFQGCALLDRVLLRRDISSIEGFSHNGYVCPNGASCGCAAGFEDEERDANFFACTQCGPGYFSGSTSLDEACQPCPPGTYIGESGASTCLQCGMGKHLDTEGGNSVAMCQNCEAGTYGDIAGLPMCSSCPSGKFSSALKATSVSACIDCPLGKFAAESGVSACSACPVGTFGGTVGISKCSPCTLGRYSSSASSTECLPCPKNTYTATEGGTSQLDCLRCPTGTSASAGSRQCEDCPAGRYANEEGAECIKCLEGSSTNGLTGLSECLQCQAGYFQPGQGAAECKECGVNSYSQAGSIECIACPAGKTTNGLKGFAECAVPSTQLSSASELDLRSREGVLNLFRTGMAYMITLILVGAFAVFGWLILSNRARNARLCPLSTPLILGRVAVAALSMSSEAFMLAIMFAEGEATNKTFTTLGLVVVGFRSGNIVITALILYSIFGNSDHASAKKYKKCFDREHFLEAIYPYAALSFIAGLECQMTFLLPWKYSEFSLLAKGFPDMLTLRATSYYKILQDSARFICNIMYLIEAKNEAAEASVEVMTYFNLLASIASIILASMVAIMKNSILEEVEANKGTATDTEGEVDGGIELGASEALGERDDSTVEYTANPLIYPGTEEGPILRDVKDKTSVRNFLMRLLPDIDASSLHAVDSAFRHDGVVTVGDLMLYLEGGVLTVSDLKAYSKAGKLTMSRTLTLTKAVEQLLIRLGTTTREGPNTGARGAGILRTPESILHDPAAVTSPLPTRVYMSPGPTLAPTERGTRTGQAAAAVASPAASALLEIAASLETLTSQVRAKAIENVEDRGAGGEDDRRQSIAIPSSIVPKRLSSVMSSVTEMSSITSLGRALDESEKDPDPGTHEPSDTAQ